MQSSVSNEDKTGLRELAARKAGRSACKNSLEKKECLPAKMRMTQNLQIRHVNEKREIACEHAGTRPSHPMCSIDRARKSINPLLASDEIDRLYISAFSI